MRIRTAVDLGNVIRERRRQLGLDQRTLALRVGVSRQWIVEIEKGKPRAEVALLLRTLTALEIDLQAETADSPPAQQALLPPVIDIDAIVEDARTRPW